MLKDLSFKLSKKIDSTLKASKVSIDTEKIIKEFLPVDLIGNIYLKQKEGILIIEANSKVVANEVYFIKNKIINKLKEQGILVRDIIVK